MMLVPCRNLCDVGQSVVQLSRVFLSQDLENQALAEAEAWREQQMQLQEQQALQNRAKQENEAEVERYKQVSYSQISIN